MEQKKTPYFDLNEFVDSIRLQPRILEHLDQVNEDFYNHFKKLFAYDKLSVVYFWIDLLYKELDQSRLIERTVAFKHLSETDAFFDTLQMNHSRIHHLQSFLVNYDSKITNGQYRTSPVKISGTENGKEKVYYWPPDAEDVPKFMNQFIEIYKKNNNLTLHSDPFIKSSLIHLLFVKIHPYLNGNGRTVRMIHNIKFTEQMNKLYGMRLKLCPLNISQNINLNKYSYSDRLGEIDFCANMTEQNNTAINKWFDFILTMCDEQIYYMENRLQIYSKTLEKIAQDEIPSGEKDSVFVKKVDAMRIKKL